MRATSADKPWDFSHVLGLIDSLSNHATGDNELWKREDGGPEQRHSQKSENQQAGDIAHAHRVEQRDFAAPTSALGDFSRIYQYLGHPLSSPAPAVQSSDSIEPKGEVVELSSKDDYASDGATHLKSRFSGTKNVQWDDQISAEDPATDNASDTSVMPDSPTLTKSQRKKKNRRERKAKEAAAAAKAATVSESEADVVARKKTPATKASVHVRAGTPNKKYDLRLRNESDKVVHNGSAQNQGPPTASIQKAVERLEAAKKANAEAKVTESDVTPSKPPRVNLARTTSHPPAFAQNDKSLEQKWPLTPSQKQTTQFIPSSVQPPSQSAAGPTHMTSEKQLQNTASTLQQSLQKSAPTKQPRTIQPMVVRSGEDRHWALLLKLLGDFSSDRAYLINPMNLTTHNNDPKGIHVFVDASNIFIGFNDQLKRSRGIPPWAQVPTVDLSFDALALLMERRRPVAKRVLAGSNPWLAAFDKAKAVGYECSILEKVYKARELTERQIYFREQDRLLGRGRAKAPPANSVTTLNGGSNGRGSGSETTTPQYARPAMIEQGVDEILHLKILESVVDSDEPSTIVLATGDAAQAEYSEGFMAMAERALKKGWTVELVSWSKNISAMYTRKAWTDAWGQKFRVIFLDDYAEELLAM